MRADDVRARRFMATKWREGYDMREVDDLMDRAAVALEAMAAGRGVPSLLQAADVQRARFQATKFRMGYDQDEVDDFLDELAAALDAARFALAPDAAAPDDAATGESRLGASARQEEPYGRGIDAATLRAVRLERRRFIAGYAPAEVDLFVARAATALDEQRRGHRVSVTRDDVVAVRFSATLLREGYPQGPVDDLLDRVAYTLGGA